MISITKEEIIEILKTKELDLITTHKKLSVPIINRIFKKMVSGIEFDEIKICGKLIIDGHHRYVSSLLADMNLGKV